MLFSYSIEAVLTDDLGQRQHANAAANSALRAKDMAFA